VEDGVFFVKGGRCAGADTEADTEAEAEIVDDCYAYFDG
jgi:hypothetical protein